MGVHIYAYACVCICVFVCVSECVCVCMCVLCMCECVCLLLMLNSSLLAFVQMFLEPIIPDALEYAKLRLPPHRQHYVIDSDLACALSRHGLTVYHESSGDAFPLSYGTIIPAFRSSCL